MSSSSSPSSSPFAFSPDPLSPSPPIDQLCYVHCNFCNTVLAVSVPCSSLLKTVTVRCGHCTNLLSVNLRDLHFDHSYFNPQTLSGEIRDASVNTLINQPFMNESMMQVAPGTKDIPKSPSVNRPPEKRQRVPSAYNRFIKDEIQRIKAGNPDISHREAFSAAAKNWAHFPHIHFGLMSDPPVKKLNIRQQDGEERLMKDGLCDPAANFGVSPY